VGIIVAVFLFGVLAVQIFYYFEHYESDDYWTKFIIGVVCTLELTDIICLINLFYTIAIKNFDNPILLHKKTPWSQIASLIISSTNNGIVQALFAYRVKELFKRWEFTVFCWALNTFRVITTFVLCIMASKTNVFKYLCTHGNWLLAIIVVNAFQDFIVAVPLGLHLARLEQRSPRPRVTLMRLFFTSLESGVIMFLLEIGVLIACSLSMQNFVWFSIRLCMSQVYANALLLSLNGRRDRYNPYLFKGMQKDRHPIMRSETPTRGRIDEIRIQMSNITTNSPTTSTHETRNIDAPYNKESGFEDLSYVVNMCKD